ncbi:2'-5' RNA ligase family protein [Haloimpatiens sp. FM7315]|uniref:2'-5' RNA ligase family protein n=1 Tax=Haloimpatiens sp. FM7315 TaxID=3298609 RepID=UPI0035A3D35D
MRGENMESINVNNSNIKRCIMIFPEFENVDLINNIRKKYDPLFEKVQGHITLVFPFVSDIREEKLKDYLKNTLKEINSFKLVLQGVTKVEEEIGNFLFLNLKVGAKDVIKLHEKLYSEILKEYRPEWLNRVQYVPHMTIGSFSNKEDLEKAYKDVVKLRNEFKIIVDKVSVEIIDKDENSIIEMEIKLKNT